MVDIVKVRLQCPECDAEALAWPPVGATYCRPCTYGPNGEASLRWVSGIGSEMSRRLRENGYEFVSDLQAASVEALTEVEGIRPTRAKSYLRKVDGGVAPPEWKQTNYIIIEAWFSNGHHAVDPALGPSGKPVQLADITAEE